MSKSFTRTLLVGASCAAMLGSMAGSATAQQVQPLAPVTSALGTVVVPESSRPDRTEAATRSHTHLRLVIPNRPQGNHPATGGADFMAETPASLACVYRRIPRSDRCSPSAATAVATGGSRMIAIVDAYDHPNIVDNLATYSQTFGLPPANFSVVFASGTRPAQDRTGGWEQEEALDVEMAHALAPAAQIVLVEAASNYDTDLYKAVDVASKLVAQAGGGEVSMSFGRSEQSTDHLLDVHFQTPGVVYFASSGDDPGVEFPATSVHVVAVGGTTIARDPNTGDFLGEATWSDGGGGPSAYIPAPRYQNNIRYRSGPMRATPDIAAIANPSSPVNVYSYIPGSTSNTGWLLFGGTSVASPLVAAIANATATFRPSSFGQLLNLYGNAGAQGFRSITRGICGPGGSYDPTLIWNACVGLGSPQRPPPF